jgi:hypothetical protein
VPVRHAHDAHCGKCGALLYSLVREAKFVHVTLGTLVDSPSIRPSAHIFVRSKAPWYTMKNSSRDSSSLDAPVRLVARSHAVC